MPRTECGMKATPPQFVDAATGRELLRTARRAAELELGVSHDSHADTLKIAGRFGGAFVTFWNGDSLRGCVGTFASTDDIAPTIEEVTRKSLADSRFVSRPVTADELPSITIEISLLSDATRTDNPLLLVPGIHGIIVRHGGRSGCFLPKVASDRGWTAEEFLANCCSMKAGLPPDAWRESGAEVLLFTAQVISERPSA